IRISPRPHCHRSRRMRRVVIVLADGLRPDAVTPSLMPSLDALAREYTTALHATTVRPSTTVAALASLATGVRPESHGLIQPGLAFLNKLRVLRPVAWELGRRRLPTRIIASQLVPTERAIVWALATAAGIGTITTTGRRASAVGLAARQAADTHDAGVLFVYLNDCDQAGHAHGWMSRPYLDAAAE